MNGKHPSFSSRSVPVVDTPENVSLSDPPPAAEPEIPVDRLQDQGPDTIISPTEDHNLRGVIDAAAEETPGTVPPDGAKHEPDTDPDTSLQPEDPSLLSDMGLEQGSPVPDPDEEEGVDAALTENPDTDADPETSTTDILERLKQAGIIASNETIAEAADKIAGLINHSTGITDPENEGYVTSRRARWLLGRGKSAFGTGAMTVSLGNYRVWQVVDAFSEKAGTKRFSLNQFWGAEQTPSDKPLFEIGRRVYADHILPLFDRPGYQHIQSIDQFTTELGMGSNAFSNFMGSLHFGYLTEDGKPAQGATADDVQAGMTFKPSGALQGIADFFGCPDVEQILPKSLWLQAVQSASDNDFKKSHFFMRLKRFSEVDLNDRARGVLERMRDSGLEPDEILHSSLISNISLPT